MDKHVLTRRQFLKFGVVGAATLAVNPLKMPSLAQQDTTLLEPQETFLQLHPSFDATQTWSFGSGPSPVLRFKQSERAWIEVNNEFSESLSVHWHGLRVPNDMDGVAHLTQEPILPGEGFSYSFDLPDAGTYWYHTHSNSQEQLGRGLAGAFIVEEAIPPDVDEDVVLLIQDWRLNRQGQIQDDFYNRHDLAHNGRLGNVVSVNQEIQPTFSFRPKARLRLRFINASTARLYRPQMPDNWQAWLVALDGQPTPVQPFDAFLLAPGMRADVIVDVPEQGDFSIVDNAYDAYTLFYISLTGQPLSSRSAPPLAIQPNPIRVPEANAEQLTLLLEGGAMSGMMGQRNSIWQLNGKGMDELTNSQPMFILDHGKSYVMQIDNRTAFAHPMHLHGHSFQILDPAGYNRFSDSVLLRPQQRTSIAFVADNPGDWLLHCHVLGHQAAGMMALIKVV